MSVLEAGRVGPNSSDSGWPGLSYTRLSHEQQKELFPAHLVGMAALGALGFPLC